MSCLDEDQTSEMAIRLGQSYVRVGAPGGDLTTVMPHRSEEGESYVKISIFHPLRFSSAMPSADTRAWLTAKHRKLVGLDMPT